MLGLLVLERNCSPADVERVNGDVQQFLDLLYRAGEGDIGATRSHRINLHPVGLKPRHDGGNVRVRGPVELAELLRREPLVIVRRRLVLEFRVVFVQRGLLLAAARKNQPHVRELGGSGRLTPIEFRPGNRGHVSGQDHQRSLVHRAGDAGRDLRALCDQLELRKSAVKITGRQRRQRISVLLDLSSETRNQARNVNSACAELRGRLGFTTYRLTCQSGAIRQSGLIRLCKPFRSNPDCEHAVEQRFMGNAPVGAGGHV